MNFYYNILNMEIRKSQCDKVATCVGKIKDFVKRENLKSMMNYVFYNKPPLFYTFLDKSGLTPFFAYIQLDEIEFSSGLKENQIDFEKAKAFLESYENIKDVKKSPYKLFLMEKGQLSELEVESREEALYQLYGNCLEKLEKGKVFQPTYWTYCRPPNSFILLNKEKQPVGFAYIQDLKTNKDFTKVNPCDIILRPDLVKYIYGEIL